MKRHDIYVNGSMVKEGFAVSSGSVSVVVERIKEDIPEKDDEGAVVVVKVEAAEQKSVEEAGNRTLRSHSKPGYVDSNGLIYLEQEPVLNALRKVINAKFADSSAIDKFYSDNEPCMAKFHQDNKFYRPQSHQLSPLQGPVHRLRQHRRGGYCRSAQERQLRPRPHPDKPLPPHERRPKEGNTWPTEVLDTLHSLIVDKQCQIRVDNDIDADAAGVVCPKVRECDSREPSRPVEWSDLVASEN
ncbi:hypothetical protein pipiens_017562 [Culex pipiens pipiens]|uniref:Uncharacterized protein n=1 Tax=Culex pipiens pipiens TaxID=38569 RepID=A0ABD1CGP0_CULPP